LQYYDASDQKILATVGLQRDFFEKGAEQLFVLLPHLWVDAVTYAAAFNRALDDARIFQFFEMLGGSRLGKPDFVYQVTANTGILFDQVLQNGNPGGVRDGFGHVGDVILLFGK
jgi:hypothetical protein